jgi:hypothetical protein
MQRKWGVRLSVDYLRRTHEPRKLARDMGISFGSAMEILNYVAANALLRMASSSLGDDGPSIGNRIFPLEGE